VAPALRRDRFTATRLTNGALYSVGSVITDRSNRRGMCYATNGLSIIEGIGLFAPQHGANILPIGNETE
jgi:hypothetical protein